VGLAEKEQRCDSSGCHPSIKQFWLTTWNSTHGLGSLDFEQVPWFDEGLGGHRIRCARYLKSRRNRRNEMFGGVGGDTLLGAGRGRQHTRPLCASSLRVMRWMKDNGGRAGLHAAILQVAAGMRRLPKSL